MSGFSEVDNLYNIVRLEIRNASSKKDVDDNQSEDYSNYSGSTAKSPSSERSNRSAVASEERQPDYDTYEVSLLSRSLDWTGTAGYM